MQDRRNDLKKQIKILPDSSRFGSMYQVKFELVFCETLLLF